MGLFLFVLLIGMPIAELYVIVQVAQGIGVLETLVLLIGISVAGAWLLKQQGLATWARLQQTLARGEMPGKEVTDGALILLGGALLLTPGFLTDAVGLVFLIPPSRAAVKRASRGLLKGWAKKQYAPGVRIYNATVVRNRTEERGTTQSPPQPRPLGSSHPRDEDDSPGRG